MYVQTLNAVLESALKEFGEMLVMQELVDCLDVPPPLASEYANVDSQDVRDRFELVSRYVEF